jgi:protein SEY1
MDYSYLQGWLELEAAVKTGPVTSFGTTLGAIIDFYLSELVI